LPVAGKEFAQEMGELGDVGAVAGVGVAEQRDRAVAGDDQAKSDQPQSTRFCFALPRWAMGALSLPESM
jgi:hypothetical protein